MQELLPHLAGVIVESAAAEGGVLVIRARDRAGQGTCPRCGQVSSRRHGWYQRRLADAPAGGRRVVICLTASRFACRNPGCPQVTFARQVAGLAVRYARVTVLLAGQLAAVAAALCGRPASRLASRVLAVQVSRHTLIRIVMSLPVPAGGHPLVRVLGVDDFSLRKGRDYATLLVDMETGRPVDVLPGREAATVTAWLEQHPEVEVICRDRAGAYAEAARDGAPQAVQVADRWHLWHNLCEYAVTAVARHAACLPGPGCASHDGDGDDEQDGDRPGQHDDGGLEAVVRARHALVHQLRAAGKTQQQAAAELGLSKQLTGRFWRASTAAELLRARVSPALEPFTPRLERRWAEGMTNTAALHREITALGYPGGELTVYRWAAVRKLAAPAKPAAPAPPTKRQAATWMLTSPEHLSSDARQQLPAILARCPELTDLAGHITGFAKILTRRLGKDRLSAWLEAAGDCPDLASLVTGIRRDHQAVINAVTLPFSSGRVEGNNTRSKRIERDMYGRAGFPLTRQRILLTS